jgi:vacuolar-type H+-ATPase subunit F/Vma7
MSYSISKKEIAVLGDEMFIKGFKLGGASVAISLNTKKGTDDRNLSNKVRSAISRLFENPNIGVVIVQEELKKYVERFRNVSNQPIIVYLPSGRSADKSKIRKYYNYLIRSYLGISLEV